MQALAEEITAAAAVIESTRDHPEIARIVLMPHLRRIAALSSEAVAADEAETRALAAAICRDVFSPPDDAESPQ